MDQQSKPFVLSENARKWAEALESGEFEQGRGSLEKDGKFCCLGVACRVAIANGVPVTRDDRYQNNLGVSYDGHTAALPRSVKDWLGLVSDSGAYDHRTETLVSDNDHRHHSFSVIAHTIRTQPTLYQEYVDES